MQTYSFLKRMKHQSRQENIIYLVLWVMLFMSPILSFYIRSINDDYFTFDWNEVWYIWFKFGVFFLLFLMHNFLLAPLLVHAHKRFLYFSTTICIVALFTIYQCNTRPDEFKRHHHHPMEQKMEHRGDRPDFEQFDREMPFDTPHKSRHLRHRQGPPPAIIGEHDIISVIILILMFGVNLGIKGYYNHRYDQRKLESLEKENLEQQLEYLKYQLNPHFLMNTLNNIHALIDIEPPKAQQAIIQLSKILRYVLYESNGDRVLMNKEVEFMENYVKLMRMRYGDKLTFSVSSPDDGTGVLIPPMLFIAFVENAFKHGVSYQAPSFINVTSKRYKGSRNEERLLWTCSNSKHAKSSTVNVPRQGGVGINNVRKRLDLIFGNDYSLTISDGDSRFDVALDIPLG